MFEILRNPNPKKTSEFNLIVKKANDELEKKNYPSLETLIRKLKSEGVSLALSPGARRIVAEDHAEHVLTLLNEESKPLPTAATLHYDSYAHKGAAGKLREKSLIASASKSEESSFAALVKTAFGKMIKMDHSEGAPGTISSNKILRLDLQGYFTDEATGNRYANFQIQKNIIRSKGESTTVSAVLLHKPHTKAEGLFEYTEDELLKAFTTSQERKIAIRIVSEIADRTTLTHKSLLSVSPVASRSSSAAAIAVTPLGLSATAGAGGKRILPLPESKVCAGAGSDASSRDSRSSSLGSSISIFSAETDAETAHKFTLTRLEDEEGNIIGTTSGILHKYEEIEELKVGDDDVENGAYNFYLKFASKMLVDELDRLKARSIYSAGVAEAHEDGTMRTLSFEV